MIKITLANGNIVNVTNRQWAVWNAVLNKFLDSGDAFLLVKGFTNRDFLAARAKRGEIFIASAHPSRRRRASARPR